jgi:hypothetical protein
MSFSQKEISMIVDMYVDGSSFRIISKAMKRSNWAVFDCVKHSGVHKPRSVRKYSINHNFFDEINSSEQAYWLGFILADAYVACTPSGNKFVRFNLSVKDEEHLRKFKNSVKYDGKIFRTVKTEKNGNKHEISSLSVYSALLFESLKRIGVIDFKKSGSTRVMDSVRSHLIRHLMRGMFDGDGMVYFHKPSKQIGVGYCDQHLETVKWFQDQLVKNTGLSPVKISRDKGNCYRFQYRGNRQVVSIHKWLYGEAEVYLSRKKDKYDHLLKQVMH